MENLCAACVSTGKHRELLNFSAAQAWRVGLEYRFKPLEYNGLKGIVGEHLARSFIRNELSLKLATEEGWDHVLFSNGNRKHNAWNWNKKLFSYDSFREDFIVHGFCANVKLLSKYAAAASVLVQNNCNPDGMLLKLKDTGKTKRFKDSVRPPLARFRTSPSPKQKGSVEYPVVSGDMEIVEIKCGRKAKLVDKQKETYNKLIAKGVPLRMINVRIVSFDLNKFLVEEHKHERFL